MLLEAYQQLSSLPEPIQLRILAVVALGVGAFIGLILCEESQRASLQLCGWVLKNLPAFAVAILVARNLHGMPPLISLPEVYIGVLICLGLSLACVAIGIVWLIGSWLHRLVRYVS